MPCGVSFIAGVLALFVSASGCLAFEHGQWYSDMARKPWTIESCQSNWTQSDSKLFGTVNIPSVSSDESLDYTLESATKATRTDLFEVPVQESRDVILPERSAQVQSTLGESPESNTLKAEAAVAPSAGGRWSLRLPRLSPTTSAALRQEAPCSPLTALLRTEQSGSSTSGTSSAIETAAYPVHQENERASFFSYAVPSSLATSRDGSAPFRLGEKNFAHPFGWIEIRFNSVMPIRKWTGVLDKVRHERELYRRCDGAAARCTLPALAAWRAIIHSVRGLDQWSQIREVNKFVNSFPYKDDLDNYGVSDYWASPAEFARNGGDCEDYAIMKFVALRELGFDNNKMRIVVVRDISRQVVHAVVALRVDGKTYILDSLTNRILPDDKITWYAPQYSFNETTRWAHVAPPAPLVRMASREVGSLD